jgi:hypothetical protein
MEIRHLLRSQANDVFEAIKNAELEPTDFDWQDTVLRQIINIPLLLT